LAVDVHPAHGLMQGAQIEPARQLAGWRRNRDHPGTRRADRVENSPQRLAVDLEVAEIEGFAVAAVGGQDRGRAAAPDADLEQIAAHVLGLLEVEQAPPQGIRMEAEPARDRLDLFPTQHHGLANSAVLTLQGLPACPGPAGPVEPAGAA